MATFQITIDTERDDDLFCLRLHLVAQWRAKIYQNHSMLSDLLRSNSRGFETWVVAEELRRSFAPIAERLASVICWEDAIKRERPLASDEERAQDVYTYLGIEEERDDPDPG